MFLRRQHTELEDTEKADTLQKPAHITHTRESADRTDTPDKVRNLQKKGFWEDNTQNKKTPRRLQKSAHFTHSRESADRIGIPDKEPPKERLLRRQHTEDTEKADTLQKPAHSTHTGVPADRHAR